MTQPIKLTKLAECAGCGAKVGAGELARLLEGLDVRRDPNLLVGFDKSDDAAVYRVSEDLAIVETLDFFPPIADDPYTYGAIAAANALSDVWAMGGEPKVALNIMAVPEDMPKDVVHQILRGGYEKVYEAGASIVGGHSIYDEEPKYGLSVTGFVEPGSMWTNAGAREGDVLVYTKPLGIGIVVTAAKGGLATPEQLSLAEEAMMRLNRWPHDVALEGGFTVDAATDVTGFGVMGHLLEMAQGPASPARWTPAPSTCCPAPWRRRGWACCPPAPTATATSPRTTWTAETPSSPYSTCSSPPRPRAACCSPCPPRRRMPSWRP